MAGWDPGGQGTLGGSSDKRKGWWVAGRAGMGLEEEPKPREGGRGPENDWLEEEQGPEETGDAARKRGTWPEAWVRGMGGGGSRRGAVGACSAGVGVGWGGSKNGDMGTRVA